MAIKQITMRELPTQDTGFSRAFVKTLSLIEHRDIVQLRNYYWSLRDYYMANSGRKRVKELSRGQRMGIYKELKDIEYFFRLTKNELHNFFVQ